MIKNYDQSVEINHNPNRPYIPDHHYRIFIIDGSGSGKTHVLLSIRKNQRPESDEIYLYVKDPFESKYQLLINIYEYSNDKDILAEKALLEKTATLKRFEYSPSSKKLKARTDNAKKQY